LASIPLVPLVFDPFVQHLGLRSAN